MFKTDYGAIFEQMLINRDQRTDSYDKPTTLQVQEFIIEFNVKFPALRREKRLELLMDVTGRKIYSTKDLRLGELDVLKKLLNNPQFVRDYQAEYNHVR